MTNAEKVPDSEWLRDLAVGLEALGLKADCPELICIADRLERQDAWVERAKLVLKIESIGDCICLVGAPHPCIHCSAGNLLIDLIVEEANG